MKNSKTSISLIVFFLLVFSNVSLSYGQDEKRERKNVYSTSGGEFIFSWADVTVDGKDATVITRFSPVFNGQWQLHMDMGQHFGLVTGVSIRNVGLIYDDPTKINTRFKARTYTAGIPLGLKIGNMSALHLFGGYEIEFPFNYKEKAFVNDSKEEKNTDWFSSKTPSVYQSFFAGFQTPYGAQLKFKYYITNFFNKDYVGNDGNGNAYKPYEKIDANVFYVSLSIQILNGTHFYYKH
jgi:hypothetical protein